MSAEIGKESAVPCGGNKAFTRELRSEAPQIGLANSITREVVFNGGLRKRILQLIRKIIFVSDHRIKAGFASSSRSVYLRFAGMSIGPGTHIPRIWVSWPHQVSLGRDCHLEDGVRFKFDLQYALGPSIIVRDRVFIGVDVEFNISKGIEIGEDSLISAGVRFIDHDHGFDPNVPIRTQPSSEAPIAIGRDCWLGANAVILKGARLGDGAIIGAGSVVTCSVPAGEIWAGVPARFMRFRDSSSQTAVP